MHEPPMASEDACRGTSHLQHEARRSPAVGLHTLADLGQLHRNGLSHEDGKRLLGFEAASTYTHFRRPASYKKRSFQRHEPDRDIASFRDRPGTASRIEKPW